MPLRIDKEYVKVDRNEKELRKRIHVVAAIIERKSTDGTAKIFATQRGYGQYKDWWEFPGGKVESGETPEEALIREIREELSAEIRINKFLMTVEYDYPEFHLSMDCYICELVSDHIDLLEHEDAKWLSVSDIDTVKWLPADIEVVNNLKRK